jgi:hypothetical protein
MSEIPPMRSFQTPQEYYSSFSKISNFQRKFNDIDDESQFRTYLSYLQDAQTRNFVLDFGNECAWCAVNLDQEDVALLLRSTVCEQR